jgi:hypothetical protein
MSLASVEIATWAFRVTPAGAVDHTPPARRIAGTEAGGADKDERGGFEELGRHTGVKRRIRGSLGKGHIASRIDKLGELNVRNLSPVDGERLHHNPPCRPFLGIFRLRPKSEFPTFELYLGGGRIRTAARRLIRGETVRGRPAVLGPATTHDK